uniref:Zinc finger protein 385B-like n=1 Tax=Callorhinchus milii TaxID=7868 RepID=A0A4W3GY12_CALMI
HYQTPPPTHPHHSSPPPHHHHAQALWGAILRAESAVLMQVVLLNNNNNYSPGLDPALVPTPPRLLRSLLDVKPLISFHFDTTSAPVQLFPNFSALEPVQKAIISHTFGVPFSPRKKQAISCHVCQLRFNSQNQAESHYRGNKHARKVKGLESNKMKPITADHRGSDQSITPNPISKTAGTTDNNTPITTLDSAVSNAKIYYCTKHKALVEAHSGAGPIKVYPRSSRKVKAQTILACGLQEKNFHCQLCDVRVHSDLQLKQHISSRKHKERVGRKTSRSKYNPYSKQHRHIATPVSPSAPLSICLSLCLSVCPSVSTALTRALLRSALSPAHTSFPPILFAPY